MGTAFASNTPTGAVHASAARILARGLRETLHGFRKGSMSLRARQARKGQRGYL